MSSGRKQDAIWAYFQKVAAGKGQPVRAICNGCKKEMVGLVARMKEHYSSCRHSQTAEVEEDDIEASNLIPPAGGAGEIIGPDLSLDSLEDQPTSSSTLIDVLHSPSPLSSCKSFMDSIFFEKPTPTN